MFGSKNEFHDKEKESEKYGDRDNVCDKKSAKEKGNFQANDLHFM